MDKPFLIAEIGINHNGDINIAKKLIDEAILAGFDAVKFQKRDVNLVYSKEILDTPRESPWGKTTREQKNALEFNFDDYKKIDNYCKSKNIDWFAGATDGGTALAMINDKEPKPGFIKPVIQKLLNESFFVCWILKVYCSARI